MKKLFTLFALLMMIVIGAKAEDFTITPIKDGYLSPGNLAKITLGDNTKVSSGQIQTNTKATNGTFTITTNAPGVYLKSASFKDENSGKLAEFECTSGGELSGPSSSVYTFTASANTTSASFRVKSTSSGNLKLGTISIVVTNGTLNNMETLATFSKSGDDFSFTTTCNGATVTTPSVALSSTQWTASSNNISAPSSNDSKTITVTSEKNIKFIAFVDTQCRLSIAETSSTGGTVDGASWTAPNSGNVKSVTFKNGLGTSLTINKIYVITQPADPVDPEFSLTKTTISTEETSQIQVGDKGNLDGISFDGDVTFGTEGIVNVNASGVVTPVAPGTTTINFATSAVASKYNASTGNSLTITVTAPVVATPTISPATFDTDDQEVTITCTTDGATIYYTTDGSDPTTSNDVYDPTHKPTISSTTTFKAYAVKTGYDDSEIATTIVKRMKSAVVGNWDFTNWSDATITGVKADGTNWRDYETSGTDKPLNEKVYSNKEGNATFVYGTTTTIPETEGLTFKTTAYTFGLAFDQASTSIATGGYHGSKYLWLYGSNSTITIPNLTAGATIEIGLESHKLDGTDDAKRTLTVTNTDEGSYKTDAYTEQTFTVTADGDVKITPSKGMHVYYITVTDNVETVPVTPAAGKTYTTFSSTKALNFSGVEGLEAYAAVSAASGKVVMTKVTDIPANTGLVLKKTGTDDSYNVPVGTATSLGVDNKLVAATTDTAVEAYNVAGPFNYILKNGEFHPATAGTLAAGKAYLHLDASAGQQGLVMEFDDAPTAVEAVQDVQEFNGSKVQKVIKNGQLFIGNYNVAGARVK